MRGEFGEHFISLSGPVNWLPRSCDLKPLDYFLWVYVKGDVYTGKPASIDALEDNIEAFICEKCWKEYAKIALSEWTIWSAIASSTFAWNNLQTLNYMNRTIDFNKDFIHFFELYASFFEKLCLALALVIRSKMNFVSAIFSYFLKLFLKFLIKNK